MKKYSNIIDGVRRYEEKNHIHYIMTNGILFGAFKCIDLLDSVIIVIINSLLISSFIMKNEVRDAFSASSVVTLTVSTVILAVGMIFLLTKYKLAGAVLQIISLPCMLYVLINEYKDSIFEKEFLFRHLIPAAVVIICLAVMLVVILIEQLNFSKSYKKFTEKLYSEFTKISSDVSDEKWKEYLKNYSVSGDK